MGAYPITPPPIRDGRGAAPGDDPPDLGVQANRRMWTFSTSPTAMNMAMIDEPP